MQRRAPLLTNVTLALIVLALLAIEAYIVLIKHRFGGDRVALGALCKQDGLSSVGSNETPSKDVYVNCSGFHS